MKTSIDGEATMLVNALGARQIKAARALLDWSQEDLALAAQLSIATIRKLELGYISPRLSTTSVIRRAIETAGLEFIDPDGVRSRPDEIATYQGANGMAAFFDDLCQTVRKTGGDVAFIETPDTRLLQTPDADNLRQMEKVLDVSASLFIRCLMTEAFDMPLSTPRFEYRFLSRHYVDPLPFCVFGDKFAMVVSNKNAAPKLIVMRSICVAQASRRQFDSMWDKATPVGVAATGAVNEGRVGKR